MSFFCRKKLQHHHHQWKRNQNLSKYVTTLWFFVFVAFIPAKLFRFDRSASDGQCSVQACDLSVTRCFFVCFRRPPKPRRPPTKQRMGNLRLRFVFLRISATHNFILCSFILEVCNYQQCVEKNSYFILVLACTNCA